ncbi:hypothetical protein BDR26DRAFT_854333 [Obelidium mucronatum]|nr:hypothetical protein BDR26DRAFT_854333 [Obelidium mucronatum]
MPTLTLPLFSAVDFVCTGAATFIVTVEHAKDTKVPTLNYTKIEGSDDVLAKTEITTTLTGPESLTIKVTAPPIAFRFFGVFGPFLELALTLTLPSDIQDFSFQGSNGKLLVESGANFSRSFDCKWESGCLKVSTPLTTESFSAATNTGTIELFGGGIRASKFLSLETRMGAIKGSTLEASGFSLATETGSIQFDSIVASATATNTTTNTSSTPQTSNDINIETNTGSVKVSFLSCTSLGITTQTGSIKNQ